MARSRKKGHGARCKQAGDHKHRTLASARAGGARRARPRAGDSQPAASEPEGIPSRGGRKVTLVAALASALTGVCIFMATADHDIWPLAWVGLIPLLWVIDGAATARRALCFGWFCGTITNVGGFYWIASLLERFAYLPSALAIAILVVLCAYQGLVFALFAYTLWRIRKRTHMSMVWLAPLVMVACEAVVPMIFPWYLAITQAWIVPVIQIAELGGPMAVTALVCVVNGALFDGIVDSRRFRSLAAAAVIVSACLAFGGWRMSVVDSARSRADKLRVGIVQGNVPHDEKGIDHPDRAIDQLHDLQRASADLERRGAELVVWTESSYPYSIDRSTDSDFSPRQQGRVRRGFEVPLLFGAVTREVGDPRPYNTAILLDSEDRFVARFDKIFLMMFGEYVPFVDRFPSLRRYVPEQAGNFQPGRDTKILPLKLPGREVRIGPMICYEDIVPSFGRALAGFRPDLLVNMTNDAWFGDTAEPWQHMALSVFRAVEMRTDLVRAVNTGVSAYIDANGRVIQESYAVDPAVTPAKVDTLLDEVALLEGGNTVYAWIGDVPAYGCVIVCALFLWRRRRASPGRQKK